MTFLPSLRRLVIAFSFVLLLLMAACKPADDGSGSAESAGQSSSPDASQTPNAAEAASLVLKNAYVYTVDATRSVAEAVAIRDNAIIFVGSNAEVAAHVDEHTDVRDLKGAMVMPGIHDMHIHALGTVSPDMCDLDSQGYSLEDLVPVLQECIERYDIAPGEWLIVLQWNFSDNNMPSERLPNMRAALDAVSTEHPVFLWGNDGHHGAANSAAFALATNADGEVIGMNAETLKDEFAKLQPMVAVDENGRPSGGINESARMAVRSNFMGDFLGANADPASVMPRVAAVLAESGVTSIQDAWVGPEVLAMYGWLEQSGGMTFRLRAALGEPSPASVDTIDEHFEALKAQREQYRDSPLIQANAVKLFADSVLEGNPLTSPPTLPVAAMLDGFKQPIFAGSIEDGSFDIAGYVDQDSERCQTVQADPSAFSEKDAMENFKEENGYFPQQCIPYSGILEHEEEFIRSYIQKATAAGFHVHVHALADKGVRVTIDEFAKTKELADDSGLTQSIAHAQVVHPDDQKRMGELGVSAVLTLVWTISGLEYEMSVAPFIDELEGVADLYNPDHYYMKNVYPANSILEFGGNIVHGSDAPVGSRNPMPMFNLQGAVTRGSGETVLNPMERLDIHEAIAAFTINGARLFGHQDRLGSIEAGKIADLVVLDQNIVEMAEDGRADQIGETRSLMTVFDGDIVFERTD
jgi:predicted amidohydrolase YtcJ